MSVLVTHPGTGAQLTVTEDQLVHMRISGWLTQAEHDANQAPADDPAPKSDGKTAPKEK